MTIAELFTELSHAGLSIRRVDGDQIEVTGDVTRLTAPVKAALAEHKQLLLAAMPDPEAKPPAKGTPVPAYLSLPASELPWWWSNELSRPDNQAIDDFMSYDPELGPAGEVERIVITEGCERCGSILGWVDVQGVEHCLGHEKPALRSYTHQAATLRVNAAQRLADPSVPMYGRARPYRGRKQRAGFAGAVR